MIYDTVFCKIVLCYMSIQWPSKAWATYLPGGGADRSSSQLQAPARNFCGCLRMVAMKSQVPPSLGFFRVFRALRPLRSLNAVPQMKAGVEEETLLGSWAPRVRVGMSIKTSPRASH